MLPSDPTPLRELIDAHERFLHVTHVNPDADGVGSALAMHRWLRRLGKDSAIVLPSEFSSGLSWMHEPDELQVADLARLDPWPADAVTILYDVSHLRRFAHLETALRAATGPMVVIDHHDKDTDVEGLVYIDETAGSTSQLVQLLLEAWGVELDHELALPLYVAMVADTGSFNYGKTSPETHRAAARLLEAGVDPLDVHGRLEGNHALDSLKAAGEAVARIQRDEQDPRIAWLVLDEALIEAAGEEGFEALNLVNRTISIRGVLAGFLLKPHGDSESRLSLRSKGAVSIVETAKSFGGGGHRNAAGAAFQVPPAQALELLLPKLRAELARQLGPPA